MRARNPAEGQGRAGQPGEKLGGRGSGRVPSRWAPQVGSGHVFCCKDSDCYVLLYAEKTVSLITLLLLLLSLLTTKRKKRKEEEA